MELWSLLVVRTKRQGRDSRYLLVRGGLVGETLQSKLLRPTRQGTLSIRQVNLKRRRISLAGFPVERVLAPFDGSGGA